MQVNKAAVVYGLQRERESRLLPSTAEEPHPVHRGYAMLRYRVTQSETFGAFCRARDREWVEFGSAAASGTSDLDITESTCKITPMFRRNGAERYNNGTHKAQRLNGRIHNTRDSFSATYCVLYTRKLRGSKEGRLKIKRKGSKTIQWCSSCLQAICSSCCDDRHSKPRLKRAKPTTTEIWDVERTLRPLKRRQVQGT